MSDVVIPISKRARAYGYVFWPASEDPAVSRLLEGHDAVEVEFCGTSVGRKAVDRKHRRISVGRRRTSQLEARVTSFRLRMLPGGVLEVAAE